MFNKNCKRHSDQEITHFCSNQLCPSFFTFYCTQCDISKCNKHYHLQQFENFENFLSKLILPQFGKKNNKQIEYCKSQMTKIVANFNSIQTKIINDYDEAIDKIINYIKQKSKSFKDEIISQIQNQKQFIEEKLNEFQSTINSFYTSYKLIYDQTQNILNTQDDNLHIEDYYRKVDMGELQEKYNILLRMQPELEILTTENSLQITKEQQLIDSLNQNVYSDLKDKIQEQSQNILTLLWSKYYSMTSNIFLYDNNNSSIVQSEIVENIRISRSISQSNYSVFNEIDNIIAMGQQLQVNNLNTSLKLKSQTYGYTKFNLLTLGLYNQIQNHMDLTQKVPSINSYCILVIKNQNIVITAGEGSEIYLWIKKKDSNSWKMEASLSLNKDISYVQCMELLFNPFINESRTSRQSFANLKILLNPIIAICSNNTIIIIQYDIITNNLIVQSKYTLKEQKEQEIHCIIQCQTMGSYNYFLIGMEKGTLILFNYIISIDNTFTIKTEQIIKHHKDCITSIEIVGEQIIAISSNDRSVTLWNFYNNKLKLIPIKMNRFWEDISCVRQVYPNCFITFDTNFNIQQWFLDDQNKITILNAITANKLKLEIHEALIINNPENIQDFCIFLLTKELTTKNYKLIILDRNLEIVQQEQLPQEFISQIAIKKKHVQYFTNQKMRIINDSQASKSFSSFTDLKQNKSSNTQQTQQQQQSFSQQKQLNQSKRVSIGIINNNKINQHFIEISYQIASD